ncbi:hypothetical protein K3495_g16833, partial [Podosphaera aphanis]
MLQQAARMRNGPSHPHLESIPINGLVRVWREGENKKGLWTGPWKLVDKDGETITVDINGKHRNFRSTSVRKWFDKDDDLGDVQNQSHNSQTQQQNQPQPTSVPPQIPIRRSQRERRFQGNYQYQIESEDDPCQTFLSTQEQESLQLSIDLRRRGLIKTPGEPFEASTRQEIEGL